MCVGTIVIASRDYHEGGGPRLWDFTSEKSVAVFTVDEVGIIVETSLVGNQVRILTSSGNIGWTTRTTLIPLQSSSEVW